MYINNADQHLSLNRPNSKRDSSRSVVARETSGQPQKDGHSKSIAAKTNRLEHTKQHTAPVSNNTAVTKVDYFDRTAALSVHANNDAHSTSTIRGKLVEDVGNWRSRAAIDAYTSHDELEQRQEYTQKLGIDFFA